MAHTLTVGQLAHATGVPAKTIRYYEQVGVLPVSRRSATGYRQYAQRDVHRLLFIRRARALGLSLPSIKALTAALDSGQCLSMRPQLTHMVTEQLRTVREQIVHGHLESAAQGTRRSRRTQCLGEAAFEFGGAGCRHEDALRRHARCAVIQR